MKKNMAANAVYSVLNRTTNVLFSLVSHMYITRVLMPEGVGAADYAQNLALYFVYFALLGIPTYGIRTIAQQGEDPKAIGKVFSELFTLNAVSTTLSTIAYYALVTFAPPFRENRALYWILGIQVLLSYFNVDWLYQGREDYRFIALRCVAVKISALIAMVLLVHSADDLLLYGVVICIGSAGNYILNVLGAHRLVTPDFHSMNIRRHIRPVLVMFVSVAAVELYSRIDITMLGILCSDSAVGYYSSAQRMVTAIVTATTAVSVIFLPRLSLLFREDRNAFCSLAETGIRAVMFFALPCFVGLEVIAPDLIVFLFGEAFLPAVGVMRILAVLIFLRSIGDVICYQIVMSMGKEKTYMFTYLAAVVVNIALNSLLIPRLAQNGAAFASVISELFVELILAGIVLRTIKLRVSAGFLLRMTAACLLMAGAAAGLAAVLSCPVWLKVLAETAVGALVYLAAGLLLKNEFMIYALQALKARGSRKS